MFAVYGLLAFLFSNRVVSAGKDDCVTIGIIDNGTGLVETKTFSRHGHTFVIVKHLVDTTEVFNVLSSVERLDADTSVDVIVLLDYEISILKIPHILTTKNKKLIKLGARSRHVQTVPKGQNVEEMRSPPCATLDSSVLHTPSEDIYCLTDLNITGMDGDDVLLKMPVPRAIRVIVKLLKWRSIVIFYEYSTELEISAIVDGLSKDGVLFVMYNADHVTDIQDVLRGIYQANKMIHIVIAGRLVNTKRILTAANTFDSLYKDKTLMKMKSSWLIVLYDYSPSASRVLQECARDIDNIAILAVPEQRNVDIEILYKGVESIIFDLVMEKTTNKDHGEFRNQFIDRLEKNAQSWNPTSKCQGYHIDTMLWRKKGREFSPVGYADINGDVVVNTDIFPNTKYGYNKRSFLVSTLPYSPFVIKKKVNNSYIYEGFVMDLLYELANTLNFTFNFTEPADRKWGALVNPVNVTFNGLVGQLQREEVDIVASAISAQAERDQVMDFSYPYYYGYTTVLVKKPDVNATKWRTLIDPFKWKVLVAIGASLVVVTILAFLLERYNPFYDTPEHAENRQINGGLHDWHSAFWYVFGALLCQGGVHLPESIAGRTLISCWWLTCIIIVGIYCGNLIAFLTVTKEKPPFNTLQEMNNLKGTYKWGTLGGTVWESMFPNSSNPTFRAMGQAFLEFNKTDPTILHQKPSFHVQRVKKGQYAWIGDKTYMEIAMSTECRLMTIKEEFMPLIYVLGFKNNSSHAAIFSEQMMKIHEGGLLQIWKKKWWPKSSFCGGSSIPEAKPISLMDVQSAFYVCFIGIFLGLSVIFGEIILHKYWSYTKNGKTESESVPKNKAKLSKFSIKRININRKIKQTRL